MIAWLKKLFSRKKYKDLKKAGAVMRTKTAQELMKRGRK